VLIYSFSLFIAFLLAFRYIKAFNISTINPWIVPAAFVVKVLAGLFFLYVYSVHYGNGELTADAGAFLKESKILNGVFYQSPSDYFKLLTGYHETSDLMFKYLSDTEHWDVGTMTIINDSKNVLRVHSLIHFISFNQQFIHLLFMCLISLLGLVQLHKAFSSFSKIHPAIFFIIILLIPSTLFWTSGILKEPFMFLGLALFLRGAFDLQLGLRKLLLIPLGLLLMILFKPYVLVCLLPAGFYLLIHKYIAKQRVIVSLAIWVVSIVAIILVFPQTEKTVTTYLSRKQFDFENVGKGGLHVLDDTCFYYFRPEQINSLQLESGKAELLQPIDAYIIFFGMVEEPIPIHLKPTGEKWPVVYYDKGCDSYIKTTLIENSTKQLIINIPEALTNSIFRPFLGDPGSSLKYSAFIELWGIFIFLGYCIIKHRKLGPNERGLIVAMTIFALCLFLLIGWTTPVIGAIVRYRFPAHLAMVIIGLIIIKPKQFFKG
jgi:hypothetical protein